MIPQNKHEWHSLICGCEKEPNECSKYIVIRNLYQLSNIPKNKWFINFDFENKNNIDSEIFSQLGLIKNNISNVVNNGVNILVYSENCGNGKTTMMYMLLSAYMDSVVNIAGFNRYGLFMNTITFLNDLKQNINYKDVEFQEIYNDMYSIPLLILDDIGSCRTSEYNQEMLYNLINYRLDNGLSTFYTSNCSDSKMRENLGERVFSRVWNNSQKVKLFGEDRRGG